MSEAPTGQPVETSVETPASSIAPIDQDAVVEPTGTDNTARPDLIRRRQPDQAGDAGENQSEAGSAASEPGGSEAASTADSSEAGSTPQAPRTGQNRRRRGSRGGRGRGRSGGGTGGGGGEGHEGSSSLKDGAEDPAVPPGSGHGDAPAVDAPLSSAASSSVVLPSAGPNGVGDGAGPGARTVPAPRPKIGDTRRAAPIVAAPASSPTGGTRPGNGRRSGRSGTGGSGGEGRTGEARQGATQDPERRADVAGEQRTATPKSQLVSKDDDAVDSPRSSNRRGGRERRGKAVGRYMIAVHVQPHMTQIALLEGRTLVEHYVSRVSDDDTQIDGNIYRGRVQNVLPGMEAAFIDIGTPKNAVLYRGDVRYDTDDIESGASRQPRIEEVLRPGQTILCQVTKNPIGAKGARLTQEVSLPGRFVVLVPNSAAFGISKRLDDGERKRLRRIVDAVRPTGHGLIVRTAAAGASEDELRHDVERLVSEWEGIAADALKGSGPTLLYQEPDIAVRVIREELNREYRGVVIDDLALFEKVRDYVNAVNPELVDRVEYYDRGEEPLPVFERFHVHEQLHKALDRKVYLPSGGSLVIDRTEALTVIDVNTGKNVGKTNLEETVYRNNLEAAEEVARQLRLRDIGGIIVIDFIDMEVRENRNKVSSALRSALARDKTRTQVFDISELGLVEMTRKRVSEGLIESLSTTCEICDGRGIVFDDAEL